jgi:hypothetical protein
MKRLATSPYTVLVLAAVAALFALVLGTWSSPQAPAPDPLAALSSATLCPSYDVAFWSRLGAVDPQLVKEARAYCATHHGRPNCQALSTASFLATLTRDQAPGGEDRPAPSPPATATPRTSSLPEP